MMDFSAYTFRAARIEDIDQMLPLIIECLKGPNGKTNYEVIFDLSENVVYEMIGNLMKQPISNHEFHYGNYMVCEQNGEILSICSGWKEKGNVVGSESIRSNLIASFLGLEKWQKAYPMIEEFAAINIPRQEGYLYLENASTKKGHRQKNIAYKLVCDLIKTRKSEFPELEKIHSHVYLSNKVMYGMFLRFQYEVEKVNRIPASSVLHEVFPVEGLALVSIPIQKYIDLYNYNMENYKQL